jgi:hypothetical protein
VQDEGRIGEDPFGRLRVDILRRMSSAGIVGVRGSWESTAYSRQPTAKEGKQRGTHRRDAEGAENGTQRREPTVYTQQSTAENKEQRRGIGL